jgi:hypothetical protein
MTQLIYSFTLILLFCFSSFGAKSSSQLVEVSVHSISTHDGTVSSNILEDKDYNFWNVPGRPKWSKLRSRATLIKVRIIKDGNIEPEGGEAVIKIGSKVETYQWENKFLGDSSYTYPILLQETGCEKIEISVSTKYKDKKVKEKRSIPFSCGD